MHGPDHPVGAVSFLRTPACTRRGSWNNDDVPEKKKWSDLSPRARAAIVVGGIAEAIITVIALRDLRRRPAASVRGPKVLWLPVFAVQPFGPIAYFFLGRRPTQ